MGGVTVIEHLWIPMPDGTRLSARLWLPETRPAACVLEYIPYRKRDGTRGRDEPMHGFFAEAGFAAIRVDMRGTGESEGLCNDEYLQVELDDACAVIDWIARQDWCSGSVGMMGKSWGGFNCLQVAALQPPALKAVVTVCSTVDRFNDDIHYMGGCLLNDNMWWGAIMLAYQARPIDGRIVGESWRDDWIRRLETMPFWPALWMEHRTRDAYWKHGSVGEDYAKIKVPVLAFGGWADSYTNAVPALLENLSVPARGIIGPWAHVYAHDGTPTPAMGFLDEATAWWERFLNGRDNGAEKAPQLVAWVEDWRKPETTIAASPGRWVAESAWPSPSITMTPLSLGDGTLSVSGPAGPDLSIRSPAYVGASAGEWMGAGCISEMPADQRIDDGFSLCFDTGPIAEDLDMLGRAELELEFASDMPMAQIAVRLNDVAPDGTALRVSYAVRNLCHRDGFEDPEALAPGRFYRVSIPLKVAGHRFAKGHRIRIALSTGYWPIVWPSRDAATLTIRTATSRLNLPVRPNRDEAAVTVAPPRAAADAPTTQLRPGTFDRTASLDLVNDTMTYVTDAKGGVFGEGVLRFDDIDVSLDHEIKRTMTIKGDDPLSARAEISERYEMVVAGDVFTTLIETALSSDADGFVMTGRLVALENGEPVVERNWHEHFPRWPL